MNQKGFANIILVVVIVVLIGAVGYFAFVKKSTPIAQQTPTPTPTSTQTKTPALTPTPTPKDETANWKMYQNEKYGFEVKYPKNWSESILQSQTFPNLFEINLKPLQENSIPVFSVIINAENLPYKPYMGEKNRENMTMGGIGFTKVNFQTTVSEEGCQQGLQGFWIFKASLEDRKKEDLRLWGMGCRGDEATFVVLDQILSTFKFTK